MTMDHNYNHMNNINHEFHHFNTGKLFIIFKKMVFKKNMYVLGGKGIYQNQNSPDYYYEDSRPKVDQINNIPQLVSLKNIKHLN